MAKKEKIYWINTLKLLASFFVVWSHLNITLDTVHPHFLTIADWDSPFNIFTILCAGNLWVSVFCMLSGYFIGRKKPSSIKELLSLIVNRYIRFLFPFLFSYFIILLLYFVPGFGNAAYDSAFGSGWVADIYNTPLTVSQSLKYIFLMDDQINPFIWTVRPILIGNIFTYVMNFITRKLDDKKRFICYAILFTVLALFFIATKNRLFYATICFFGAILPQIFELAKKIKPYLSGILLFVTIVLFSNHNRIVNPVLSRLPLPGPEDIYYLNTCWNAVYAFLLLFAIVNLSSLQNVLNAKPFRKISDLSLSVFFIHCPILFALVLPAIEFFAARTGVFGVTVYTYLLTNALVLVAAFIFHKTFDRLSDFLFVKIRNALNTKVFRLSK